MTTKELKELLESIDGFKNKVAYLAFEEGSAPKLPFICYYMDEINPFGADGINYYNARDYVIELYSKLRNEEIEKKLEDKLTEAEIFYQKQVTYLDDERMYEAIYLIEI